MHFLILLALGAPRCAGAMDLGAAHSLFERQAYAVAADAYRDLLSRSPGPREDAEERLGLAECLYRLGQYGPARQAFESELERHVIGPQRGQALLGLARACAKLKDFDTSVRAAQGAEAALPHAQAWKAVLLKAEDLYAANRFEGAEAAYGSLAAGWPSQPEPEYVNYAIAWCDYRLGRRLLAQAPASSAGRQSLRAAAAGFERAAQRAPAGAFAPGALYQEGECDYALGLWSSAQRAWKTFLARYQSDPLAPAARYSLAWCSFQEGRYADAATAFHEFSVIYADHPLAPWGLYLAGVSLARVHNLDLAESAYRISLRLYPQSPVAERCQYALAWLATQRKDYPAAAEAWAEFLKRWPDSSLAVSASFLLADSQYQQGRYAAAHDQYLDLLRRHPHDPLSGDALYYAANASMALEDWARARSEFQAYLDRHPRSPYASDALMRSADCLYFSGDLAAAESAYRSLRSRFRGMPAAGQAQEGLAWVSFARRDWTKAADRFTAAAGMLPSPESGRAWLRVGDALFNAGEHARAKAAYLKAAGSGYPRDIQAQAHDGAAWADYRLEDFKGAYGEWARARDLAPGDIAQSEAAYWMGWALFRLGRFTDSAAAFAAVAPRHPKSYLVPDALTQEANALHNAGQDARALPLYRRVASQWPRLPAAADALHGLEISYSALGRQDEALAAEREFLKLHADSDVAPDVQYQIAEHYLGLKEWPQAERELDRLKAQFPGSKMDTLATYWRGEARYHQLKFNAAIADWNDLVHRAPANPLAPRALFRVGLAWYRQQEYPQAEDAFRRVLDAYGNTREVAADARFNLALTYKRMGRDADAVAAYQAVIRDYPGSRLDDMARIRIGYIYEDARDFPKALDAYRDLAARDRGKLGAEAQYLAGDCLVSMKRDGEAVLAYDAVAKTFPGQGVWAVTALARAAEILESEGRYRDALRRYETIARTSPDPAWAASARARIVLMRKRLGLPDPAAAPRKKKPARKAARARRRKGPAAHRTPTGEAKP